MHKPQNVICFRCRNKTQTELEVLQLKRWAHILMYVFGCSIIAACGAVVLFFLPMAYLYVHRCRMCGGQLSKSNTPT